MALRIWIMTEIEYNDNGKATILRSFSKPSKSSSVQYGQKKVAQPKQQTKQVEDVDLF